MTMQEKQAMDRLAREKLNLQDRLDDIMSGFELWRQYKTQSMELTTLDEMLIRWVEYDDGKGSE